jgi:multidrug efflux system membrane fusion protein
VNTQKLVALGIVVLVVVWMVVPRSPASLDDGAEAAVEPDIVALQEGQSSASDRTGYTVRAARLGARDFIETVRVRGRTEAFRSVDVRAEQAGRVVATPVTEGSRVEAGAVLCEIAVDTRESDLLEAESRQQQTRVEYDAALDLQRQGLTSSVTVAQAKAAHDSATAAVARARLALDNIRVRAPFAGVVEARPVEIGDLLERGTVCATVVDDVPMLLVGLVPEQQIGKLRLGASVNAELLTGQQVSGTVTFLSRSAEQVSRSYRIEAEIQQQSGSILDGITAEIFVAASEIRAHLIPASALTLDDNGVVGVKTLDADNVVNFSNVTVVGDQTSLLDAGIWVSGLPEQVTLITHGQEIVFPGQRVKSDFSWSTDRP